MCEDEGMGERSTDGPTALTTRLAPSDPEQTEGQGGGSGGGAAAWRAGGCARAPLHPIPYALAAG